MSQIVIEPNVEEHVQEDFEESCGWFKQNSKELKDLKHAKEEKELEWSKKIRDENRKVQDAEHEVHLLEQQRDRDLRNIQHKIDVQKHADKVKK